MMYSKTILEKTDDLYKEVSTSLLGTEPDNYEKIKILVELLCRVHNAYHCALDLYQYELRTEKES